MNTKRIRRVTLWSGLLLLVALVALVFLPVPPHGRFSTPQIGNEADAYIEASAGKLTWVVFGGLRGREGKELRKLIGNYRKDGWRWILVMPDGSTSELRATPLALRIIYPGTRPDGPFYRYEVYKGY